MLPFSWGIYSLPESFCKLFSGLQNVVITLYTYKFVIMYYCMCKAIHRQCRALLASLWEAFGPVRSLTKICRQIRFVCALRQQFYIIWFLQISTSVEINFDNVFYSKAFRSGEIFLARKFVLFMWCSSGNLQMFFNSRAPDICIFSDFPF